MFIHDGSIHFQFLLFIFFFIIDNRYLRPRMYKYNNIRSSIFRDDKKICLWFSNKRIDDASKPLLSLFPLKFFRRNPKYDATWNEKYPKRHVVPIGRLQCLILKRKRNFTFAEMALVCISRAHDANNANNFQMKHLFSKVRHMDFFFLMILLYTVYVVVWASRHCRHLFDPRDLFRASSQFYCVSVEALKTHKVLRETSRNSYNV